jgi:hypothetical protein
MAGEGESDSGGRPYFCCIANCKAQIANCMMIVYCGGRFRNEPPVKNRKVKEEYLNDN